MLEILLMSLLLAGNEFILDLFDKTILIKLYVERERDM